jgi:hypothetical protein
METLFDLAPDERAEPLNITTGIKGYRIFIKGENRPVIVVHTEKKQPIQGVRFPGELSALTVVQGKQVVKEVIRLQDEYYVSVASALREVQRAHKFEGNKMIKLEFKEFVDNEKQKKLEVTEKISEQTKKSIAYIDKFEDKQVGILCLLRNVKLTEGKKLGYLK